jgi:hypothetical protein
MSIPAYRLYLAGNGYKDVTTPATAVQLSTTDTACRWIYITADHANTGIMAVGISTVLATASTRAGIALDKGVSCMIPARNLNEVWLDATVTGEGCSYAYYTNTVP